MRLGEICEIISGYTFRGSVNSFQYGGQKVIQAKDIDLDSFYVNSANLVSISIENLSANSKTKSGDIVLTSKHKFISGIVNEPNILVTSSLYILRVSITNVMPEYLVMYLNSRYGQEQLNRIITGGKIKIITKNYLTDLIVPIPALETQLKLINLCKNVKAQEKIYERKRRLNQEVLEKIIKLSIDKV